eukprot:TRINITY_DN52223_c0_g1_i1.p1 TRINITY_DN52223_c0_g1~~TRINITY_DN52223_c0_g1_i1.p1  ORF type:complete len:224 (+),score=35.35 TRINITY_DN52223_c0_g1_i1:91-762(+)
MTHVLEQLPPRWSEMCRAANTTQYCWAHDGVRKNGTVELKENGLLLTPWCEGTWTVVDPEQEILEMTFGSSRHYCRPRDGGFVVEEKYLTRSGKSNYKHDAPKTCGWLKTLQIPRRAGGGTRQKRVATRKDEDGEEDVHHDPTFSSGDLKFEVFVQCWSDFHGQRTSRDIGLRSQRAHFSSMGPPIGDGAGAFGAHRRMPKRDREEEPMELAVKEQKIEINTN